MIFDILIGILISIIPFVIYRLAKGPTVMDRVLCLDCMSVIFVAIMVILSMKWKTNHYLDMILVFSTFGFIGTIAFSFYLHKTYNKDVAHIEAQESEET